MDIAHTVSVDGTLGVRSENTIDALKKSLGVDHLELVVLNGIDDYRELLVERPPPKQRRLLPLALLLLVAYLGASMLLHPGTVLDNFFL